MFNLGGWELGVILVIALLVYDPKQLPDVVRQGARAWRGVREVTNTVSREFHGALRELELDEDLNPPETPRPYAGPSFTPVEHTAAVEPAEVDPYVAAMQPDEPSAPSEPPA